MRTPVIILSIVLFALGCGEKPHDVHAGHEAPQGMDTVHAADATAIDHQLRPTNQVVLGTFATVSLEHLTLPITIPATGTFTYDPSGTEVVSARAPGWIEKLYVKYQYQAVTKGQKLMDLYSRELVTEQENFLFLLANDPGNTAMLTAVRRKLVLLGLTEAQVEEVASSRKSLRTITIYSPATGHLHEPGSTAPGDGSMAMAPTAGKELALREGMFLERGQTAFTIYGTHVVWAMLNIHPSDGHDHVRTGQAVRLTIDGTSQDTIMARTGLIEPLYHEGRSLLSVRVPLNNPDGRIKIGSRVSATVDAGTIEGDFVPASAVVSTGYRSTVFVQGEGAFTTREVRTGITTKGMVQIMEGLRPGERLARNGQLLIDSESFIRTSP